MLWGSKFEPCKWRTCPWMPDVFISRTTADFLLRNEACEIVRREYPSEWEINSSFFSIFFFDKNTSIFIHFSVCSWIRIELNRPLQLSFCSKKYSVSKCVWRPKRTYVYRKSEKRKLSLISIIFAYFHIIYTQFFI